MASIVLKSKVISAGNHQFNITLFQEKPFHTFQVSAHFDKSRIFSGTYSTKASATKAFQRECKRLEEEAK